MTKSFISELPLSHCSLWDKFESKERTLVSFELQLTSRCNNDCRHCCVNLPVRDKRAINNELTFKEIKDIVDQAADLGAFWCLITGGEPLLRKDFPDIYLYIKRKGILVSVFTNATLINNTHVELFKKYPPRVIEVTVYGVTQRVYEQVTNRKGSFKDFMRGLNLLLDNGIKVRLKAMVMRSNVKELPEIAQFCRQRTKDYFRFDPFLHLRFDGDKIKNARIRSERLSPKKIATLESTGLEPSPPLEDILIRYNNPDLFSAAGNQLFCCVSGNKSFFISYDGYFKLCALLNHPKCIYDLKKGSLRQAYQEFALGVRNMHSNNHKFISRCNKCKINTLCLRCPAHAHLETGDLDTPIEYFCAVMQARAKVVLTKEK